MSEAVLDFFLHNEKTYNVKEFEGTYIEANPSIYEVIRIIGGVPLFVEEHYERLIQSSKLMGSPINISIDEIRSSIVHMIELNKISDYNIKIVINNLSSTEHNIYYFFISSSYPDREMYIKGVDTLLFSAVRKNPNAKVINQSLRDEVNRLLKDKNVYEALLVNNLEEITEGSRSNLFFIKDGKVFTAPEKDVLSGITRKRIINLCNKSNIEVVEAPIKAETLSSFEAAFISGTSPKVLPIRLIDTTKLDVSNTVLRKVMDAYDREIDDYINKYK